ncbi:uncharacterized protein F13E9.13, mitochondrial-like isoform X2 [Artemia franciscana]|uniref:uncharacterized protein F13E9.13, mitochondrial-like isoform X2 n=1 Tax=Artemia franciscana TaxID=6661 RepID=UPI0032D9EBD4
MIQQHPGDKWLSKDGSPRHTLAIEEICDIACTEAKKLCSAGIDGIIVENMHDVPYIRGADVGPHTIACMTKICTEVRKVVPSGYPCGLQILASANMEAMAVAHATGFQFIRAEGFVFGHIADEGWTEACAGPLLRYKKNIGADRVSIIVDIKKKHGSHAVTSDVSLVDTAEAAQFFQADGVVVTGTATGRPSDPQEVRDIQNACRDLPVIVGSGVSPKNLKLFRNAHALIIGSYLKKDGIWMNELDVKRITEMVDLVKTIRSEE